MAAGIKVADVYVDISGDITKYRKSLGEAQKEALTVGAQIRAALHADKGKLGDQTFNSGLARIVQDVRLGQLSLRSFANNLPGVARDLGRLSVQGLTSGLHVLENVGHRVFHGLKSAAENVFKGIAIGAGIAAFTSLEHVIARVVETIPELINRGKEYAETIHSITLETGESTEVVSKNVAIYQFLGGTAANFETQLVRLSARVATNRQRFEELGIATRDSNGRTLNAIELLTNLRTTLSRFGDEQKKVEVLFKLFGQRGAQAFEPLIHFMGLTDEAFTELAKHMEEQGLVIDESQARLADEIQRSENNVANSITGLSQVLLREFGPALVSFWDGLAATITDNGKVIAETLTNIGIQFVGLVEGLLGLGAAADSFSTHFTRANEGLPPINERLITLNGELATLQAKLKPAGGAAAGFASGVAAGTKALEAQGKAVDAQIAKLKRLGDAQETQFRRGLAALQRTLTLEGQLLDAEDKRIGREHDALQASRDLRDATVEVAKAKAKLAQDALDDAAAVAAATDPAARADAEAEAIRNQSQNVDALAAAQEHYNDVVAANAETARDNANEDRRAQIQGVQDYIDGVQKIVDDSENKKAALNTLQRRKAKLEQELALAEASGNAQAVADIKLRLAAVDQGIDQETKKIKQDKEVDELTAYKTLLEAKKAALQGSAASSGAISRAETAEKIRLLQAEIKKEEERVAEEQKERAKEKHQREVDFADLASSFEDVVNPAFEKSRQAGLKWAESIKGAIAGIIDLILGAESKVAIGPAGPRTGGLLSALGAIAGGFAAIAPAIAGFWTALTKFDPKAVGFAIAVFGATKLNLPLVLAGLAIAGVGLVGEAIGGPHSNVDPYRALVPGLIPGAQGFDGTQQYARGGVVTRPGTVGERSAEYVLSSEQLRAVGVLDRLRAPVFSGGAAGGGVSSLAPAGYRYALVRVEATDGGIVNWMDEQLARKGRR